MCSFSVLGMGFRDLLSPCGYGVLKGKDMKKIKKTALAALRWAALTFGLFAVLAALGSCITEPVVFDESIPLEKTATVAFVMLAPTVYNGIPVDKKWLWARIPQGEASFVVDIVGAKVSGSGFILSYNFEGGKEYCLYFATDGDLYGADVYNTPPPKIGWPSKNTLIGFLPFDNQPDTIISR